MRHRKVILFLLCLGFIPLAVIGQESDWFEYKLEDVKISFPTEDVYQLDTLVNDLRLRQLYGEVEKMIFFTQLLPAENNAGDANYSELPYDEESLLKYYDGVAEGASNAIRAAKVEGEKISYDGLIGYQAKYKDPNDKVVVESKTFLAGDQLIVVSVYNPAIEKDALKKAFFESLDLSQLKSKEQFTGKSWSYRRGYFLGQMLFYLLAGGGLVFSIVYFVKKSRSARN
ncbi:MAG: hypothetical protein AAFQ94_23735 [Bacteroidota bacterium]